MKIVNGGVTAPKGFLASGIAAGIKASGKKDLALLYSEAPAVAAGAFTTNRFKASHIKVCISHLANAKCHQAIVVNSGNANCANGPSGDHDSGLMAHLAANELSLKNSEALVASTGVIGKALPVARIKKAMPGLVGELSPEGGSAFAEAILTTDTKKKELAIGLEVGQKTVRIGGACKGVGMIYPNLTAAKHATMLCFLTTDAALTKKMLYAALDEAIAESFNMISVDGDMSTNDSCFIMANGLAGNRTISSKDGDYKRFSEALKSLTKALAKELVKDGEGATKFIEIEVAGAKSSSDAKLVARKISTSNLLKACVYGEDPNWGRVAAAAGASGVKFNPGRLDIYIGNTKVLSNGARVKDYDREKTRALFKRYEIRIKVDLKSGTNRTAAWTCDFSKRYVEINAEYST